MLPLQPGLHDLGPEATNHREVHVSSLRDDEILTTRKARATALADDTDDTDVDADDADADSSDADADGSDA